jgi:hypothetical protein
VVGFGSAVLQRIPDKFGTVHQPRLPFQISRLAQTHDLMPPGNQPPRNMEELAGKVWVDEEGFFGHLVSFGLPANLGLLTASTRHDRKKSPAWLTPLLTNLVF